MNELTKKQFEVLNRHMQTNINYGIGGTFNIGKDGEKLFIKEIRIVREALRKIELNFVK